MKIRSAQGVMLFAVAFLGFAGKASAIQRISPPMLDLKADCFTVPNSGGYPTSSTLITIWGSPYVNPTWGAPAAIYPFGGHPPVGPFGAVVNTFSDYIVIGNGPMLDNSPNRYAAAAAYVTYDDTSTPTSPITFTTVYGVDNAPASPGTLSISGYSTGVAFPQFSGETITGPSGTVYAAGAGQLLTIGELGTLLGSSADMSIFTGSSTAPVWVFQTTLPFAELAVPEPTSFAVLGAACTGLLARRRR